MGWGDLIQEAVQEAEADMAKVQGAADAIQSAISRVEPWLDPATWQGSEATAWIGEWKSFYQAVQSCLNGLPAAEAQVIATVRSQMEKMAQQHAGQPAPS
jgi:uncharacterized protein YukE